MPCSDERLRPPKVRKLGSSGASGKQRPSHRSVDKAAIDEVFNEGQGPASFDAEFRLGNLRENEIVGPENAPRRQCTNSRASTPSHPKIFSNGLRRSRSSEATSGTHTTVVLLSTHRIHSSNAASPAQTVPPSSESYSAGHSHSSSCCAASRSATWREAPEVLKFRVCRRPNHETRQQNTLRPRARKGGTPCLPGSRAQSTCSSSGRRGCETECRAMR